MKTIYMADDGTVFENEDSCYKYEEDLKWKDVKNSDEIHMYDNAGVKCTNLNECFYIKVDTDRALEYVEHISDEMGLSIPDDFDIGVCYYYDADWDSWHNLTNEIKRLKKIEEIFKNS